MVEELNRINKTNKALQRTPRDLPKDLQDLLNRLDRLSA